MNRGGRPGPSVTAGVSRSVSSMIGIGVGAGAYVLTRFAVSHFLQFLSHPRFLFSLIKESRPSRASGRIQSAPPPASSLRDRLSRSVVGLVLRLKAEDLK